MQAKALAEDNRRMKQMIDERNAALARSTSTMNRFNYMERTKEMEIKMEGDNISTISSTASSPRIHSQTKHQQSESSFFPIQPLVMNDSDIFVVESDEEENESENENMTTHSTQSSITNNTTNYQPQQAALGLESICFECSNLLLFNETEQNKHNHSHEKSDF